MTTTIEQLIVQYSTNVEVSGICLDRLVADCRKLIKILTDNADIGPPVPVIAGGCIRDVVFGIPWNDVDIFLPADDPLSSLYLSIRPVNSWHLYDPTGTYNTEDREDRFTILESWSPERGMSPHKTQVILRPDAPETGEKADVLTFLDTFDYNLVKCAYSPIDGFIFHPDFLEGLSNWSLDKDSSRTYAFNSRLPSTKRLKYTNLARAGSPQTGTPILKMATANATVVDYGSNTIRIQDIWQVLPQ